MRYGVAVLLIFVFFILLRSINLFGLPLYLDEGLYLYWAKIFSQDPSSAYLSLLDGKTPLFMWLVSVTNLIFHNYLLSGRLLSILAGVVSALCWFLVVRKEVGKNESLFFLLLLLVTPYSFLIERMAFVDSLLSAFASIAILFFVYSKAFLNKRRFILLGFLFVLLSGISLGLAYMTKTSAKLFLILQLVTGLFWILGYLRKKKIWESVFIGIGLFLLYTVYNEVISYMKVGAHRLWPSIVVKENQLVYSIGDITQNILKTHDFGIYFQNFPLAVQYLEVYLGPLILLVILGTVVIIQANRKLLWLIIYALVAYMGTFLSAKVMASRYFYPAVPATIVLASIGASSLWHLKEKVIRNFFVLSWLVLFLLSSLMVLSPLHAIYTYDDQNYLVSSELSALGLQEIQTMLLTPKQTVVGISGIWGVSEGAGTLLSEKGAAVETLNQWWQKLDKNSLGVCEKDQKLIDNSCYKLNIDAVTKNDKPAKYLYLTRKDENIELLQQFGVVKEIQVFQRPLSDQKTYLIKL